MIGRLASMLKALFRTKAHARFGLALPAAWLACALAGCGGGAEVVDSGPATAADAGVSPTTRYASALRLAALARVEARAGMDDLAAEHYRAAWRQHPDPTFLVALAQAAERANHYAEAHEAAARALALAMPADQRTRLEGEVARLKTLVPPGLVRVAVQVRPEAAKVVLRSEGKATVVQRVVLGAGHVFLAPGLWNIETTAPGFQSELRTFQVGAAEGELLSIALRADEAGPALVESRPAAQPEQAAVAVPTVDPEGPSPVEKKPDTAQHLPIRVEPEKRPDPVQGPVVEFGYKKAPRQGFISRYGPFITSGVGVVAFGVGGWFGYRAAQNADAANALDNTKLSTSKYQKDFKFYQDAAEGNAGTANLLFASGGALLTAGTVWWLLAPHGSSVAAALPATPEPVVARLLRFTPVVAGKGLALNWSF